MIKTGFFILFFFVFTFLHPVKVHAQAGLEFLPVNTNFKPLRGNNQEARMGINFFPSDSHMKVDIGNSTDVLGFHSGDAYYSIGGEFMAYAYVTSYKGYRLQIDAIDGFFGGNITGRIIANENLKHYIRFRFIHNSAHLVDGHYDISDGDWINGDDPIPYTRDFAEFTYAPVIKFTSTSFRPYLLASQSVRRRPAELRRFSAATGFEFNNSSLFNKFLDKDITLFGAAHFFTAGVPEYTLSSSSQLGIKFGDWESKGISFFLSYYHGNNMFSEYYSQRIERFGVGFNFDFP